MLSKKLPKLFQRLTDLKLEFDFNNDGQEVLLNHEIKIQNDLNHFSIEITYNRPRQVIISKDFFVITLINDELIVDFQRITKSVMPFFPQLLPEKLNTKFNYSSKLDENSIFKKLMSDLASFFEEYNFAETYYKSLSE